MSSPAVPGVITTDRLVLRPARAEDAGVYRELWTERDPRVPPHRRLDAAGRPTVADLAARLAADRQSSASALLTVTRRAENDVIGYCGVRFDGNGSADEPELAYELLRRTHGNGYATEAARAIVDWAAAAGYRRLWAGVREWNDASRNVLRKLGFAETGRVDPDTRYGDSLVTTVDLALR